MKKIFITLCFTSSLMGNEFNGFKSKGDQSFYESLLQEMCKVHNTPEARCKRVRSENFEGVSPLYIERDARTGDETVVLHSDAFVHRTDNGQALSKEQQRSYLEAAAFVLADEPEVRRWYEHALEAVNLTIDLSLVGSALLVVARSLENAITGAPFLPGNTMVDGAVSGAVMGGICSALWHSVAYEHEKLSVDAHRNLKVLFSGLECPGEVGRQTEALVRLRSYLKPDLVLLGHSMPGSALKAGGYGNKK